MEPGRPPDPLQVFYDLHPYPPPVDDLDGYRRLWQDERRRRADYHLVWPEQVYRSDIKVLVAGCGTSQAAKHALRQPASQVVGIDISQTSIQHTETLKHKYGLSNLDLYQLPVERVAELGCSFDKIICTGVLHHLPDPDAGLRALRDVLKPEGAMHLMVYAAYGRAGIYMLQEYCRRLGIGNTEKEIQDLALTLTMLPIDHPLAPLLGESPDFKTRAGLADALLNPRDRAYTVAQLFDLFEKCGLSFGRWLRQAPYLAQCGSLAKSPHADRLKKLSLQEQFSAVELFRGTLLRHNLILYRDDRDADPKFPRFDGEEWQNYIPIRLPDALSVQKRLPPGAAAVLINPAHDDSDLALPVDSDQLRFIEAIDGFRSIQEITHQISSAGGSRQLSLTAKALFEQLFWYDQIVFDATK